MGKNEFVMALKIISSPLQAAFTVRYQLIQSTETIASTKGCTSQGSHATGVYSTDVNPGRRVELPGQLKITNS